MSLQALPDMQYLSNDAEADCGDPCTEFSGLDNEEY